MAEFSRSPEISEAITTIQSMPQETSLENSEKREAARSLRMEMLLCNAKFMRDASEILAMQPDANVDFLTRELTTRNRITHPEIATRYVQKMLESVDIARRVFQEISNNRQDVTITLPNNTGAVAGSIFTTGPLDATKMDPNVLEGSVSLKYPLALVVTANPALYDVLYQAKEASTTDGFYCQIGFQLESTTHQSIQFPLIVVRNTSNPSTMEHELGHHENALLTEALRDKTANGRYTVVWGETRGVQPEKVRILTDTAKPMPHDEIQSAMAYALRFSLTAAKSELLADYAPSRRKGEIPMKTRLKKVETHAVYDYPSKRLGLDRNSAAYASLRHAYLETLKLNTEAALQVISGYKRGGWETRLDLMGNVLRQVPLDGWKKFFETNLFGEEITALEQCQEYMALIREYVNDMRFAFLSIDKREVSEEVVDYYSPNDDLSRLAEIEARLADAQKKVEEIKSPDHATTPMILPLDGVRNELAQLLEAAEGYYDQSAACHYRKAFDDFVDGFPQNVQSQIGMWLKRDLAARSAKTFYGVLTNYQKKYGYMLKQSR